MRVGFINAFALPDFVSGATIQVDDLAVGMRDRGHDVAIFSGARRAAAPPLAAREYEHHGIPVRSINTEPFIDFSDPLNHDNPRAATLVREWVAGFQPDVVHAHSLQGLGAGWLDADLGVPVVVTMHDSWWICARQFLVRSDLTFDGPLADFCGCECSGGADFNQARRRWLAERLAFASAIVVPSQTHADLLAIDGVDPARIRVSPNGLRVAEFDGSRAPRPPTPPGSPPHLGFVGQWHELKGLPLLLGARRLLPDEPLPFRLSCWGAAASPEFGQLPAGVELLGPYQPSETRRVMQELDALAIPSLAPESFSLVAREALACGVPVICSDIGGQTEVIQHGVNGLVVETGSVAGWAVALGRWAGDPELRRQLAQGASVTLTATTLEQQLDELEATYLGAIAAPLAAPLPFVVGAGPGLQVTQADVGVLERGRAALATRLPGAPPPMLIVAGIGGATLRYGGYHLAEAHRSLGAGATVVDHRHPAIPDLVPAGGIVVFYRVPWSRWIARCVEAARAAGATVIFEVDDLIFDPDLRERIPALLSLPPADAELWVEDTMRYQLTARACDLVLATTPEIARAARALGMRAEVHYYGLGQETALMSQVALRVSRERRAARLREGVFRIGYLTGTNTHDDDWAMVEPAVLAILDRHPAAELWLVGPLGASGAGHPRVRRVPFMPLQALAALQTELDVVLAPQLPGLEFSEAKSAVKWIEAGAVGVPVVASPAGAFREFIEDGVTGLLAGPDGWEAALDSLAADPDLRMRIGRAAKWAVYRDHGPWARARAWRDTLQGVLDAAPAPVPAIPQGGPDRPPTPSEVEPAPPSGYADYRSGAGETTVDLAATTIEAGILPTGPGLYRIDIHTTTFGREPGAPVVLRLCGDGGEVLREGRFEPAEIADDGWSAWRFAPLDEPRRPLRLQLSQPGADRRHGAGVWASVGAGARHVGGRALEGAIYLRAWSAPSREEICADALALDLSRLAPVPGMALSNWRRLYHKGLHSVRSRGLAETAARTVAYGRRWQRGRRRRRG